MDKNYTKDFLKEIMKRHMIIGIISMIIILFLYFFLDYFYNGMAIDFIDDFFGWDIAKFVLMNQKLVIFIIILFALIINVLLVEIYSIKKISRVFSKMKILFQKDDQKIVLEESLKELEIDLNALKKESIENEKKAIQEAQQKVDMIAYLAHDIRTPLASVIGYLCLLNENELDEDMRKKCTEMVLDKSYRLERLVDEFFEITKLNQASQSLYKENVQLSYFLKQMKEEFYPLLKNKNQKININVEDNIYIYADTQKIARVFNNLIKNAIYFGDENTYIYISSKEKQNYIHIYFTNQGQTIPKDKLDLIFKQFYRLDESRSSSTGGSGLGLSIAKMIVEQHNGQIIANSYNHITTFEVILPKVTFY